VRLDGGGFEGESLGNLPRNRSYPRPPYWQNCSERSAHDEAMDSRGGDGSPPAWSLWRGNLRDLEEDSVRDKYDRGGSGAEDEGPRPPWVGIVLVFPLP
jgi:hypothetical protein